MGSLLSAIRHRRGPKDKHAQNPASPSLRTDHELSSTTSEPQSSEPPHEVDVTIEAVPKKDESSLKIPTDAASIGEDGGKLEDTLRYLDQTGETQLAEASMIPPLIPPRLEKSQHLQTAIPPRPWECRSPELLEIVKMSPEYQRLLQNQLVELTACVDVSNMFPHLQQLQVIDSIDKERIMHNATRGDMVTRLVDHLERGPLWRLHSFLRGLAMTGQEHIITQLGMDPELYQDEPMIDQFVPLPPTSMGIREEVSGSDDEEDTKAVRGSIHHCSFILEEDFNAGDSNRQSPAYAAFVSSIEQWVTDSLEYKVKISAEVAVTCISQKKRIVFVSIESRMELSEKNITKAIMSAKSGGNFCVCPGTLVFRDNISTALATAIIREKHTNESLDKRINFDSQYVKLKILSVDEISTVIRDELEQPHRYQAGLQKLGGKVITDQKLIGPGEVKKYIIIRGRAGIGKTTLVQRVMWKWAHGEWAVQFKAIFLLNLRVLMAITTEVDFVRLLTRHAVYAIGHSMSTLTVHWLERNQRQIAYVLDGVDEIKGFADYWDADSSMTGSLRGAAHPIVWGFALMKRQCVPESTLIITSRPFADLCRMKPTMTIEVMGLTRERVLEFVDRNVEADKRNKVKEALVSHPILLSVSAITFYCSALCQVLKQEAALTDRLTTYTQITAYILEIFMRRSVKESEQAMQRVGSCLGAMCRLAYDGLVKRTGRGMAQLVFDKEDFERVNLQQEDIDKARQAGVFLQTEIADPNQLDSKLVVGEFVHLSIQEFLAMAGLLMQSTDKIKQALKVLSTSGQFNMALLFLYGFAFNKTNDTVKRLCAAIGGKFEVSEEVTTLLHQHIKNVPDELQALQMVHESQSVEMARDLGRHMFPVEVRIQDSQLTVVDIMALTFLLEHHQQPNRISLFKVGLNTICMKEFCRFLNVNRTITTVHLNDEDIDDKSMGYLAKRLKTNKTLQNLGVWSNTVTDQGVTDIAESLEMNNNLQGLDIASENLTDKGVKALAEALLINTALTDLSLPWTLLGDEGAEVLLSLVTAKPQLNVELAGTDCSPDMKKKLKAEPRIKC